MGLDLSLTSPGIVVLDTMHSTPLFAPVFKTKPLDKTHNGWHGRTFYGSETARVELVRQNVVQGLRTHIPDLVLYENHAYGTHIISASTQIHELMGVIRNLLHRGAWPNLPIAPASLKKDATGNGRADKHMMLRAARELWPECPNHDLADAYHLARLALKKHVE